MADLFFHGCQKSDNTKSQEQNLKMKTVLSKFTLLFALIKQSHLGCKGVYSGLSHYSDLLILIFQYNPSDNSKSRAMADLFFHGCQKSDNTKSQEQNLKMKTVLSKFTLLNS